MTKVKQYRMGTYEVVNGKLIYKQHNRTYRGKPTKHIKSMNEERKEVRRVLSVICLSFLAMTTQITNSFDIQAEGAVAENLAVEVAAPVDYSGIPYMERNDPEDYVKDVWKSIGTMTISHYSENDSCHYPTYVNGYRQCLSASGKIVKVGMVATNLYPFGTRLLIDGDIYIVEDRISKRYNDRIDIFVGYGEEAHKEAKKLGIKKEEVKVLNN